MKKQQAVLVVSLMGLDETLLQTIPARHVYRPEEIVFNMRFADIIRTSVDGSTSMIDSSRFDELIDETAGSQAGGILQSTGP
jgi:inward rectifier potassium channel